MENMHVDIDNGFIAWQLFLENTKLLFFSLPVIFTKILITELLLIEITMCAGELRRK